MFIEIDGERVELTFVAWDSNTYKHASGCLTHTTKKWDSAGVCQCGALSRTAKIYKARAPGLNQITVLVEAPKDGWDD